MFTSNEQISPPSLVLKLLSCEVLHKRIPEVVNLKRIPTHKECKRRKFSLQTRLGVEICLSDVIMHKGHEPGLNRMRPSMTKRFFAPVAVSLQFQALS